MAQMEAPSDYGQLSADIKTPHSEAVHQINHNNSKVLDTISQHDLEPCN
jgi:hypothetical protein